MKVALTIPCTSNRRDMWKSMKDTHLYNLSFKTFLKSIEDTDTNQYKFYIGYDHDDRIFSKLAERQIMKEEVDKHANIQMEFIPLHVEKGFVTKMWNILFKKAYEDGYEYFYQCGDDLIFKTKGWVGDCTRTLKNNNDMGACGPTNNAHILTQAMFSRKHMEIFGYMFPEELKNWYCDDWYNWVYKPDDFYVLEQHQVVQSGGGSRYQIQCDQEWSKKKLDRLRALLTHLIGRDRIKLVHYKVK
jgi:hypothetical protein